MSSETAARLVPRGLQAMAAVLIGAGAAGVALQSGIPGDGSWIVACWALGFAGSAVWRHLASYALSVGGIVAFTGFSVVAMGQYGGLAWLAVLAEAAVLGHGFLVGAVIGRAWRLRSLRDARVVAGFLAAVGLAVLFVLIAQDLARNPP